MHPATSASRAKSRKALADFAVLEGLFSISPEEILETSVDLTYVDGECVFDRAAAIDR